MASKVDKWRRNSVKRRMNVSRFLVFIFYVFFVHTNRVSIVVDSNQQSSSTWWSRIGNLFKFSLSIIHAFYAFHWWNSKFTFTPVKVAISLILSCLACAANFAVYNVPNGSALEWIRRRMEDENHKNTAKKHTEKANNQIE